jgi:Signal transduction histidine kinase involved in nitrogen fixation and metabolism regulation
MKSPRIYKLSTALIIGAQSIFGIYLFKINIDWFFFMEGLALLSALVFYGLYKVLIKPYKSISNGIALLKAQDFSSTLQEVKNEEANKAVIMFNQMMEQLKSERLQVREKNHFLDLLVDVSPLGFIILDFDDNITLMNRAAIRYLDIKDVQGITGKKIHESDISLGESLSIISEGESVTLRSTGVTMLRCTRSTFIDRGFPRPYITIENLTNELLKTEKKSYESIIRMMAHEVNNSVGAVNSTLMLISDNLKVEPENNLYDILPAVNASLKRSKHLGHFISNFAEVVKIPPPALSSININDLIHHIEDVFRYELQKRNIELKLELTEPSDITADNIQLEQVFLNIVKNAYEAIGSDGKIRISTTQHPFTICIDNNGEPITKEMEEKLFSPFFTTKENGQGIGLMFIREVLVNHGFQFSLSTLLDGWTRFRIIT